MNTKLSQIEKSLKMKYRLEHNGIHDNHSGVGNCTPRAPAACGVSDGGGFGRPRNRENERLVEELQRYNSVLQRENAELKTKVKASLCSHFKKIEARSGWAGSSFYQYDKIKEQSHVITIVSTSLSWATPSAKSVFSGEKSQLHSSA